MKKVIPILVVIAVVAAAVFFFRKRQEGSLDLPAGRAAQLAPADAVLFIEVPDIARTGQRLKETLLYRIWEEPELKEFTAKWDEFKTSNEVAKEIFGAFGNLVKADPAGFFLAMTTLNSPTGAPPKMVSGFPYRGKKSDVEAVVRQFREEVLSGQPGAKPVLADYEGTAIETFTATNFTAVFAYRDNWFFFGTDEPLLKQTLDRYTGKAGAAPGLAGDPLWQATLKGGSADPDLVFFGRWAGLQKEILSGLIGGFTPPTPAPAPSPVQAMLYTVKLDGPLMRDRLYIHATTPPKTEPLSDRSVALTNTSTYVFAEASIGTAENIFQFGLWFASLMGGTNSMDKQLEPHGLSVAKILAAFGPELMATSAWEGGALYPDFFAAAEIRDKEIAGRLAEYFASEMTPVDKLVKTTEDGTTYWAQDLGIGIRPTLAINDQYLMFGLNPGAVKSALTQLKTKAPNLATKPNSDYAAALKTVITPTGGRFYLDTKFIFERLWERARPFLATELIGNAEASRYLDVSKLPKAETISKHLAPTVMSLGVTESGWLIEGTGTVNFVGFYMVSIPSFFFARSVPGNAPPPPPAVATPPSAPPQPSPAPPAR